MRKRLQAAKATYDNYSKWYDKYDQTVRMRSPKFSVAEFNKWYRDAKYQQSKITDPKERKNYMRNFSQILARRQREASELQLRVTWQALGEAKKNIAENIKKTQDAYVKKLLREKMTKGRKNLSARQLAYIEEKVQRMFDEGAPEYILKQAKKLTDQKMKEQINVLKTYEDVSYKTFRKNQRDILEEFRDAVGDRSAWNDAFAIYYEILKKRVSR